MTQTVPVKWAAAINGDWTNGADWTPSGVPTNTPAFDYFVYIGGGYTTGTAAFTVTSSANETIGFLEIGSNATFNITGGQFAIDSFLHPASVFYNYGHVTLSAGATLSFGDTGGTTSLTGGLWNYGTFALQGTLQINAPTFALFGTGVVTLGGGKIIGALTGTQKFINKGGTIKGLGSIGTGANLSFLNAQGGVVDSTTAGVLTLNTGANSISNAGTIRTDGAGGLTIVSKVQHDGQMLAMGTGALRLTNSYVHGGGSLTVGAGGSTVLRNGEISLGGVVSIASGGTMTTTTGDIGAVKSDNVYVGDVLSAGDIEDDGKIVIADHSFLNLNASVYGSGEIDMNASSGLTELEVFSTGSTLFQSGGIVMSDNVLNRIVSNGAGVQLSNSSKISGAGVIGDGWLRIANSVVGSIVANGSARLTIVADANALAAGTEKENYNGGSISSTGAGGLLFQNGTMNNGGYVIENGAGAMILQNFSFDAGGGIVQVASGRLVLQGNSQIDSQSSVTIAAGAVLTTTAGDASDEISGTLTNAGQINIAGNSTLIADGHWSNSKSIFLGVTATAATLSVVANSTLQLLGTGGTLLMSNVNDQIIGSGAKFDNKTNLIQGAGTIGANTMTIANEVGGTIDATLAGGMTINAKAEASGTTYISNAGTIKADSAAGVTITAGMYSPGKLIADAGSKIVAQGDVLGLGAATINMTGSIEFGATVQNSVYFAGSGAGALILDHSTQFTGDVFGMASGDSIDLRDFGFVAGMTGIDITQSSFGDASASITLVNGTTSSTTLHLEGSYALSSFQVVSDGTTSGGTLLKVS